MKIILHNERSPEDNAMLQALYSRSSKSVTEHLQKLQDVGSGNFMSRYYLGYGHRSIGDCGFITMYLEGVSILAAKAIEDDPLFNGQECSSRYIDFSTQPFINPFSLNGEGVDPAVPELAAIEVQYEKFRSFYVKALPIVKARMRDRFPRSENVSAQAYENAIAAKAFDVLRGYLPAGASTNVAWTTSLGRAEERLRYLMMHPLQEVNVIAAKAYEQCQKRFPNSFRVAFVVPEGEANVYQFALQAHASTMGVNELSRVTSLESFYNIPDLSPAEDWGFGTDVSEKITVKFMEDSELAYSTLNSMEVSGADSVFARHTPLSHKLIGVYTELDFGSYRDIQRHRNGYCSNFILGDFSGIGLTQHEWYLEQLPEELQEDAAELLSMVGNTHAELSMVGIDDINLQYIVPMLAKVPVVLRYSVAQAAYVAKLRSGKTVHPTLRPVAQALGSFLVEKGFQVSYDEEEDTWDEKRGTQTITEVNQNA